MRTWTAAGLAAGAALVVVAAAVPATASASPATCATPWGSTPEAGSKDAQGTLYGVRGGTHLCFDRLVLDVQGRGAGGYDVRYVPTVRRDGSGQVVPLRGAADLQIVVRAPSYDPATGRQVYRPARPSELVPTGGMRTFRQVADAGSFEGQTTIGLGVRARLPFRVQTLSGPGTGSRLVVDVAHAW